MTTISNLAESTGWGRGIIVNEKQELEEVSFILILFEKIKGLIYLENRAEPKKLQIKALRMLKAESFKGEDPPSMNLVFNNQTDVSKFLVRVGLADSLRLKKGFELSNVQGVLSELVTEIIHRFEDEKEGKGVSDIASGALEEMNKHNTIVRINRHQAITKDNVSELIDQIIAVRSALR